MNKHNNCTVSHSLSKEELQNIVGGNLPNFWSVIFQPPKNSRQN
ncbi:hypothetical protein SSUR61_0128 [Streptococcus suis R61]|uniref:Bacteriocin n=1 Tax=Streptococcus suis R61 TaxID=996306 RepID=A0AA87F6C7_STRSU|nr:hypothetical protein SSUR61_0128 [Streptococcus suis R61]